MQKGILSKALVACLAICGVTGTCASAHSQAQTTPETFNVLQKVPQFPMYWNVDLNNLGYTAPHGSVIHRDSPGSTQYVLMKLTDDQKSQIGSDLKGKITYFGGCDEFDRISSLVLLVNPKGGPDPALGGSTVEMARFITPFSDAWQGSVAKSVFPLVDLSPYASLLADTTKDIWVGIAGGSYPGYSDAPGTYSPCDSKEHTKEPDGVTPLTALDKSTGFSYSLDFVTTKPISDAADDQLKSLIAGTFKVFPQTAAISAASGQSIKGRLVVTLSGHGQDEEFTNHTYSVLVNGTEIGTFNTQMDCTPYAKSQGLNNGWNQNNSAPRNNWCPGSIVPPRTFNFDTSKDIVTAGSPINVTITRKYLRPKTAASDSLYKRICSYIGCDDYEEFPDDLSVFSSSGFSASSIKTFNQKYLQEIDPTTKVLYSGSNSGYDDVTVNYIGETPLVDFSMTPEFSNATLAPGGNARLTVQLEPVNGFNENVNSSCTITGPAGQVPLCILNIAPPDGESAIYNFSSSISSTVSQPVPLTIDIVGITTPLPAPVSTIVNAKPGNYTAVITSTAADGTTHTATINITIQ